MGPISCSASARVLGVVADGEDAAVDAWVERLDAAVQHLGEAGHVRHVAHVETRLAQRLRRPAGAEQLDAQLAQSAREIDEPRLVRDAQKRPANVPETFRVLFVHISVERRFGCQSGRQIVEQRGSPVMPGRVSVLTRTSGAVAGRGACGRAER